eukprot:s3114_g10.t3
MLGVVPAAAATLTLLIATNVAQNGSPTRKAPELRTLDDALQLKTKADFVAAWRAGSVPADYRGRVYDGYLLSLGVLAPMTLFITNVLFGPFAIWRGKSFQKGGRAGRNRFGRFESRGFAARVAASQLDDRPALVLDYGDPEHGDVLWGRILFMRDELREVGPGLLLGCSLQLVILDVDLNAVWQFEWEGHKRVKTGSRRMMPSILRQAWVPDNIRGMYVTVCDVTTSGDMQRVQVLHSVQVPPLQNARQINNAAYWPPVQTIGAKKTPRSRSPPEDVKLSDFEMLDGQGGRSLGKGSFGVVRRIRRKGTDDVYALKTMQKAEVVNGQLVEQVEREIQVQRTLKHENVLRLYKHFEDEDTVYLLLEYCAKGELYQLLRTQKGRKFSEQMSKHFFVQLVRGLKYLHSHQIVHRDLKPENLLVTHDDVLKIGDFGWCAATNVLRTTFCGTMDYLAPEMIQGSGHNHTLDIWSVGILLYEMMVGRPPFQSTNHTMLIDRILKIAIFFPPGLPPLVVDLVRRLLKRDPAQRLPLEQVLRHPWVVGTGEAATPPSDAPVSNKQLPSQPGTPPSSGTGATSKHLPLQKNGRVPSCEKVRNMASPRHRASGEAQTNERSAASTPVSSAAAPVQPQGSPVLSTPKMPHRSEQAARKPAWPTQASGYQAHRPLASPTGTPVLTRRGVAPVSGYPGNSFAATRAAAQNLSPTAPAARAVGGEASTRQSRRQSPDARTNGSQTTSTSVPPPDTRNGHVELSRTMTYKVPSPPTASNKQLTASVRPVYSSRPVRATGSPQIGSPMVARSLSPVSQSVRAIAGQGAPGVATVQSIASVLRPCPVRMAGTAVRAI